MGFTHEPMFTSKERIGIDMSKQITNYKNLSPDKIRMEEEAKMKHLFVELAIASFFYFLVPFILGIIIRPLASLLTLINMIFVNTIVVFTCSFVHTRLHGVVWYVPLLLWAMFIPSAVIFRYHITWAMFSLTYIVFGYFGILGGYVLQRRKNANKAPIGLEFAVKMSNRKNNKKNNKL